MKIGPILRNPGRVLLHIVMVGLLSQVMNNTNVNVVNMVNENVNVENKNVNVVNENVYVGNAVNENVYVGNVVNVNNVVDED